ncbi:MAG: amidase [Hydrotalea flava]|uniref:amidase n=1 Tax=Hydrotalea TaxID=1004300 RepID=UPI0009458CC5|nr:MULTISPECIES: amidase [Hydrotalea]MBY0347464.1 amidase [Hydrotalea flava]RWZ89823.1 MAG: amidase [Hydrotalea sp. AMD]
MDRRIFIKNGSLAGLAITAIATEAAVANINNYTAADFPLMETTIDAVQQNMQEGKLTARQLTEMYLKRIKAIDQSGPAINAVIEVNPDALAIAEALDKERKAGKIRGLLHGIPVLIKDNINTGDKMMTTAGSLALEGNIADKDAFVITQLRKAGAVILGKTNLSEWANWRSTRSTSGWSSRGGQTKNPNMLDRGPCGSSAGSGAAVSANLCVVAVGTETDGSVIAPSSFNGIVGIKPTVGLVSRSGIIPISATQDTAGPMARTVKDAAILLSAMTGIDEADAVTLNSKGKVPADYTQFLDASALKGKRIGIEKSFLKGHEGVVALYKAAIETLQQQGATVVEVELLKLTNPLGEAENIVLQYEFKDGVNRYLASAKGKVHSLKELIAFNNANAATVMPYFKQELLEQSEARGTLQDAAYQEAHAKSTSARAIIDNLMKTERLDAIAGTSIGPACCIDLINGDYDTGFYFCPPAAMAGYPHISVPVGTLQHLPVGFSFIAGAFEEPKLLSIAYAFEQATQKRVVPKFIPNFIPTAPLV